MEAKLIYKVQVLNEKETEKVADSACYIRAAYYICDKNNTSTSSIPTISPKQEEEAAAATVAETARCNMRATICIVTEKEDEGKKCQQIA